MEMDPKLIISYSTEPWTKVDPNIYIGGTFKLVYLASGGTAPAYNEPEGFDVVVSMAKVATEEKYRPKDAIHIAYPIVDGAIEDKDVPRLVNLAHVVSELTVDRKVLIRCRAGCNRSALVAAMTMKLARYGQVRMDDVIDDIRSVRSCALSNPLFVAYLQEFGNQ